jgi:hypothetical protein
VARALPALTTTQTFRNAQTTATDKEIKWLKAAPDRFDDGSLEQTVKLFHPSANVRSGESDVGRVLDVQL